MASRRVGSRLCGLPPPAPLLLLLLLGPWPAAGHGGKYSREKNEPGPAPTRAPGEEFRMEKLNQLWEKAQRVSAAGRSGPGPASSSRRPAGGSPASRNSRRRVHSSPATVARSAAARELGGTCSAVGGPGHLSRGQSTAGSRCGGPRRGFRAGDQRGGGALDAPGPVRASCLPLVAACAPVSPQLQLSPVKLSELHADLKMQERDEFTWKKLKLEGADADGEKEAQLRRSLSVIVAKYGLDGRKDGRKDAREVSSNALGDSAQEDGLGDPRLEKLWHKATTSGKFSTEELDRLWREFQHHQQKTQEYNVLLEALSSAPDVHENAIGPAALGPAQQELLRDKHAELKERLRALSQGFDRLREVSHQGYGARPAEFQEPRVTELWDLARSSNFSATELESLREELKHFEVKIEKHSHYQKQLEISHQKLKHVESTGDREHVSRSKERYALLEERTKQLGYQVRAARAPLLPRLPAPAPALRAGAAAGGRGQGTGPAPGWGRARGWCHLRGAAAGRASHGPPPGEEAPAGPVEPDLQSTPQRALSRSAPEAQRRTGHRTSPGAAPPPRGRRPPPPAARRPHCARSPNTRSPSAGPPLRPRSLPAACAPRGLGVLASAPGSGHCAGSQPRHTARLWVRGWHLGRVGEAWAPVCPAPEGARGPGVSLVGPRSRAACPGVGPALGPPSADGHRGRGCPDREVEELPRALGLPGGRAGPGRALATASDSAWGRALMRPRSPRHSLARVGQEMGLEASGRAGRSQVAVAVAHVPTCRLWAGVPAPLQPHSSSLVQFRCKPCAVPQAALLRTGQAGRGLSAAGRSGQALRLRGGGCL
ncbi:Alpha-2-macroglobulin receptor-associated protein [Galemys pyrenaicus]|uniref:Alpha-2-macroglobulin receptor-associated protein n=1 Tax=Galemys pyrenaicus TaxID=202257 RepID=A0A8J5ZXK2_GALPY|nr:Alpha-2-macroglobulin receptor-associated protein [Galemys pyrenaicus]